MRFAHVLITALALAAPFGCGAGPGRAKEAKVADTDHERAFAAFSKRFIGQFLEREPVWATQLGEHRFDGRWPALDEASEAAARRRLVADLGELQTISRSALSEQSAIDHAIAENRLRHALYHLDEIRAPERDPLLYTALVGDGIDPLLTRDYAPHAARMESLRQRLLGVPLIVETARRRLARSPRLHTETAIGQNKGLIALCKTGLAADLAKVAERDVEPLARAAAVAAVALEGFQAFLEKELLPRSDGDHRLGRARFEKMIQFELDDTFEADELARRARALLDQTRAEMVVTARELYPTLFPGASPPPIEPDSGRALVKAVLDRLADDRPTNATILRDSTRILAEATEFVRSRDLVRVPDEPCKVIEMPEYRRGVSIAYCDASGPLEEKPETFFAISPTPKDWSETRATSFYREYNASMLTDLVVHEAMPGHFLQLMHHNRFPSRLRAVFSSGAFVEGWAVYTEWLMAHHGYGGARVKLQRQKMLLRVAANALLDHGVHTGALDEAGALALMMKDAFQEEGEAAGKWRRAQLTSVQLSTYFYGFSEMALLRAAGEKKPGFKERAFHDTLLSFGSPSMRHARALMAAR